MAFVSRFSLFLFSVTVFLISSTSFCSFLRLSISVLTLPICSHMLSTFSIKTLNIVIIVILFPYLIIPTSLPYLRKHISCFLCFFRLCFVFLCKKAILKIRKLSPIQRCSLITAVHHSLPPISFLCGCWGDSVCCFLYCSINVSLSVQTFGCMTIC